MKLLVGMESGADTDSAIRLARQIAREADAEVELLRVLPAFSAAERASLSFSPPAGLGMFLPGAVRRQQVAAAEEADAQRALARAAEAFPDGAACVVIRDNQAGRAIAERARAIRADLIAVVARKHSWLSRLLRGSSTLQTVLDSGVAPVVTARPSSSEAEARG